MPRSFLISRRRKLSSSAWEPPEKFSRTLKACFPSGVDELRQNFPLSREPIFKDHSREHWGSYGSTAGKNLLLCERTMKHDFEMSSQSDFQCFQGPLERLCLGATSGPESQRFLSFKMLKGNEALENFKNPLNERDRIRDPSAITRHKEDFTSRRDKGLTDCNNNTEIDTCDGPKSCELLFERKEPLKSVIEHESKSAVSYDTISQIRSSYENEVVKSDLVVSLARPTIGPTDVIPYQFARESPQEDAQRNCIINSQSYSLACTDSHQVKSNRTSRSQQILNTNGSVHTRISADDWHTPDDLISTHRELSEQIKGHNLFLPEAESSSIISDNPRFKSLKSITSTVNSGFAAENNNLSDRSLLSTQLSSCLWLNGSGYHRGLFGGRINSLHDVYERRLLEHDQVDALRADKDEAGRDKDSTNICEENGRRLHVKWKNEPENAPMYTPLPTSASCSQMSALTSISSVPTSPQRTDRHDNFTPTEPALKKHSCKERGDHENNIRHLSLWHSSGSSFSPLLLGYHNTHFPVTSDVNKGALVTLETTTPPREVLNTNLCMPDRTELHGVSQLDLVDQIPLQTCKDKNDGLEKPLHVKKHTLSTQNRSDLFSGQGIRQNYTSSIYPEPLQQLNLIMPVKTVKLKKRPLKSFMISSIINEHSDDEVEEENPSFPVVNCCRNTNSDNFSIHSLLERVDDRISHCKSCNIFKGNSTCKYSNNCNTCSQIPNLIKQINDSRILRDRYSKGTPRIIFNDSKQCLSELLSVNPSVCHKTEEINSTTAKQTCTISTPLISEPLVQDMPSNMYHTFKNYNPPTNDISTELCLQSSVVPEVGSIKGAFLNVQTLNKPRGTQSLKQSRESHNFNQSYQAQDSKVVRQEQRSSQSCEAPSLNQSREVKSLNHSCEVPSLSQSLEAKSLNQSCEVSSLSQSLEAKSLNQSCEVSSLSQSREAKSLKQPCEDRSCNFLHDSHRLNQYLESSSGILSREFQRLGQSHDSNLLNQSRATHILNQSGEIQSFKQSFEAQSLNQSGEAQNVVQFNEEKVFNKSSSNAQIDNLRCPAILKQNNLTPDTILHPLDIWRRNVKGIVNPIPIRFIPRPTFFNILTPVTHNQSSFSPPIPYEHPKYSPYSVNKGIDQIKNSVTSLTDMMRHSPVSSLISSDSPLTAPSSIPSPTTSLQGINIFPDTIGYQEVPMALTQNDNSLCSKTGPRFGHDEKPAKLELNESKSFKSILEQRKVKLEVINSGHGIKNPLLSTDFVDKKLASLVPRNCSLSCPVCNLTFDLAKHLQKHLKSHREIKRFLCSFCGKGFNDTFDLKRHTRTHTGVRPYKCAQCDKAFTQRCSLESHCRKIHGLSEHLAFNERRIKLYVCEVCGHSTDLADDHYAHTRLAHPSSQLKRRISM